MSKLSVCSDEEAGDTVSLLRRRVPPVPRHEPDRSSQKRFAPKMGTLDYQLSILFGKHKLMMEHLLLNKSVERDTIENGKILTDEVPESVLALQNSEGKTALHAAIDKKYLDVCETIMNKSPSLLSEKDKKGETPLHYIVKGDLLTLCEAAMRLASPLQINTGDKQNYTPVHLAAMNDNESMLQLLIKHGGRVTSMTHHKFTALHFAAKRGFKKCVEVIVNAAKDDNAKKELMDTTTQDKSTALILAAVGGHSDCCLLLDKTNVDLQDKHGNTALHYAAQKGYLSTAQVLVGKLQADMSIVNHKGQSSLNYAASNRYEHCLTYLLDHVTVIENPEKVLLAAVESRCKNSVEKLLGRDDVRNSIDKPISTKGDTVLHVSLQKGCPAITRLLLQHGANRNIANKRMEYPLHLAAQQSNMQNTSEENEWLTMCKEILKDSHDLVNQLNNEKQNPLFLAAKFGNVGMVYSLLQKGAKVIVESNELTAIHVAAKFGHNDVMIALLRSLDATQLYEILKRKPHPLHFAAQQGHLNCCKTLLKRCKLDMTNLLDKDDKYPADLAAEQSRHGVFRFLLHEMPFDEGLKNFGCNIHRYFKKAIADKNESLMDAIIDSSWCCVVFDHSYCLGDSSSNEDRKPPTNFQRLNNQQKPCDSLVNLVKVLPRTASKALDRHIINNTDGSTLCNYTPFEFIYYDMAGDEKTSPFACGQDEKENIPRETKYQFNSQKVKHKPFPCDNKQKPKKFSQQTRPGLSLCENKEKSSQKLNDQSRVEDGNTSNKRQCCLCPQAKELGGILWGGQHPLLKPPVVKCKEILNHNLTKSWMEFKVGSYTRNLFSAYVVIFAAIALLTTGSFSCLWNTYHLEARFSGASRADITRAYNTIYYGNASDKILHEIVSDVRILSASDTNCSRHGVPVRQDVYSEALDVGSAVWNRSVCAIAHLESSSEAVFLAEVIMFTSYFLYSCGNYYIWRTAKSLGMAWFHSTRYGLLICLPLIFVPVSQCDFYLGLRPDIQWQFGVIAVLTTWLTTATAMNNVFAIFATITKHFMINYIVMMLPVFFILYGFALAFHLLLTVEEGAMTTIIDTISKTFLWILDDFDHKDIFRQNNTHLNFPTTGKLLYVMYGIIVGGLLFNLILMNTGEHLKNMKRKVNIDRSRASLQRVLLVDELFPNLRRKYAKCHVTHHSTCDHFSSQDENVGISTGNNFNAVSSSMSLSYFLHNTNETDENDVMGRITREMESLKMEVRDVLNKFEERQSLVANKT